MMDICNYIQISTYNDFVDTVTGKRFIRIERNILEGCFANELNEMYQPWVPSEKDLCTVDAATCFKLLKPELYKQFFLDYCERNNIQIANSKGFTYYFKPKEE